MNTMAIDLRRARNARLQGMGLGATAVQEAGGLVSSATGVAATLMELSPAAGPAAPIVAAVGMIVGIVSQFVGKGCGQACVESSQQEQVYEVAADICAHAVVMGMIPEADWQSIKSAIQQAGTSSLMALKQSGDKKAAAGLTNMTNVLNGLQPTAPAQAAAYNFSALLQSWLGMTNQAGWYAASLSAGEQLAQQILNQVASTSVSGALSSILPGLAGLPLGTLLLWGGIAFLVIKLL
jgi:hypothetical protein